jgi:hypothetical protein
MCVWPIQFDLIWYHSYVKKKKKVFILSPFFLFPVHKKGNKKKSEMWEWCESHCKTCHFPASYSHCFRVNWWRACHRKQRWNGHPEWMGAIQAQHISHLFCANSIHVLSCSSIFLPFWLPFLQPSNCLLNQCDWMVCVGEDWVHSYALFLSNSPFTRTVWALECGPL